MEQWFPTADASGLSWLEHLRMVYMGSRRDGDVGSVFLDSGSLQIIEGDLITNTTNDKSWVDGVQLDAYNKPSAFSVATVGINGKIVYRSVNAIDLVFLARRTRAGQTRGESLLASVFSLLDHIDNWIESEVVGARVGACFSVAVTQEAATQNLQNFAAQTVAQQSTNAPAATVANPTRPEIDLSPGSVQYLRPGEDIKTIDPAKPGADFPQALRMFLRHLGAAVGLPLELTLLDFSQTNNASARAAMLQAFRTFRTEQRIFIDTYLTRVYRWRISKFIKAGLLPYRPDAFNHRWVAPHWPMQDPVKELQSLQMGIDIGTETLTNYLQQQGHDIDTWIAQRAAEIKAMEAAGIPVIRSQTFLSYNATLPPADGVAEPSDDDGDEETDDPTDDETDTDEKDDADEEQNGGNDDAT
jgi:lambda family phage portal protein